MYKTCPKCGHERSLYDDSSNEECSACGLVYSKWLKGLLADHELEEAREAEVAAETWQKGLKNFFFHPRPDIGTGDYVTCLIIFLVFFVWGIDFISMNFRSNDIGNSWFHNVNLFFHEAGHLIFIPFGRFGSILGGSLFQIMVPFFLIFAFLFSSRDAFGASICLWWTGQSIMDLGPYIADARTLQLPLTTGGTGVDSPGMHDWENILRNWNMLEYDVQIATWVHAIGAGVLLMGLTWSLVMLFVYYKDMMD